MPTPAQDFIKLANLVGDLAASVLAILTRLEKAEKRIEELEKKNATIP